MMQYAFGLQNTHWVPVPLEFPDGDDQDVGAWASRTAAELSKGRRKYRRAILGRLTEVATVEGPRDGAAERWWLLPNPGYPEAIAHLYFEEAGASQPEDFADSGGGGVQSLRELEGTAFERAIAVELLADMGEELLGISRRIGVRAGYAAILEMFESNPTTVALPDGPLDELFRGIVLR